jgi:hypothetical protein
MRLSQYLFVFKKQEIRLTVIVISIKCPQQS